VLGESRGRASLDRCARRDARDAGNPAQIQGTIMLHDNVEQLWVLDKPGVARSATHEEIINAARRVMSRRVRRGTSMASPKLVRDFLTIKLGTLEHETFCVMLLDKRHRLIEYVELFRGTIDGALYLAMRLSIALKCL
jgi:DNA repair protein RadC